MDYSFRLYVLSSYLLLRFTHVQKRAQGGTQSREVDLHGSSSRVDPTFHIFHGLLHFILYLPLMCNTIWVVVAIKSASCRSSRVRHLSSSLLTGIRSYLVVTYHSFCRQDLLVWRRFDPAASKGKQKAKNDYDAQKRELEAR
jgi:hypothetical protein